ncbi:MAG TPA: hypothetical protein VKE74_22840 [Gemmataceae bacterium]|nr:hypothetical protein [Gemmataceae bacterium]
MSRLVAASLAALLAGCASAPTPAAQVSLKAPPSPAASPPPPPPARAQAPEPIDPAEVRALEKTVRDLLLKHMPDPLVQSAPNWGHQKEVTVGGRLKGMPVKELKNDGTWRRVMVKARYPEQTLAVGIKDAEYPEPGRATFTTMIGLDVDLKLEQQVWQNGHRLYSGETRGRCRAALMLKCEITSRTEKKPGSLLPEVIVRGRATEAQLFYQDLVIEHTAGIGGDGAKLLGDAAIYTVKQVKPDLERDLLAKANAAIVKAADTKDVRVSLDSLLKGQVPGIAKPK